MFMIVRRGMKEICHVALGGHITHNAALLYCMGWGTGGSRLSTVLCSLTPITLFVLFMSHPLSPDALCNPGPVNAVHRVPGEPRVAPTSWWPPLAGAVRSSCIVRWEAPWPGWFHPGDVHFSQDHFHPPPLPYISQPCHGLWAKGSNQAKTK